MTGSLTPAEVRLALLSRREIALVDLRDEALFASGHPLFAAQLPPERIAIEAPVRLPRREVPIVLYDDGAGRIDAAVRVLGWLGYSSVYRLAGDLSAWRATGYELFEDVNSYSKAFGELVEHRRRTPSLAAEQVHELIGQNANIAILDARRFDEYATMSLPGAVSVPGAELVLRAPAIAPETGTTIIVNCAGRTRSIIGAQSLINAGLPNRVVALRNGTIGWTLAGQSLEHGQQRRFPQVSFQQAEVAQERARNVAYRAGVKHVSMAELDAFFGETARTLYCFDVRTPEEYRSGHLPGFVSAPGGQLVQETDHFMPVRGARVVLVDDGSGRADMTASWLAQLAWETYVVDPGNEPLSEEGDPYAYPPRSPAGRYRRPYEGTDNPHAAMQSYLEWEYGLVAQLSRDGTHGFFVI